MSRISSKVGMYPVSTLNSKLLKRSMDSHTNGSSGTNTGDRPAKVPRREVCPGNSNQQVHAFGPLQHAIRDLGRLIPSKDDVSVIIDFSKKCTKLLKNDYSCFDLADQRRCSSLLEQLHGLLFLWLDFAILSFSSFDITSGDYFDGKSKLIEITNDICVCLEEVYRCANENFYTNETLQVLMKAYLLLSSDPNDVSILLDCEAMVALLRAIIGTIRNLNVDILVPFYTYQRFLLCLVFTISNSKNGSESSVRSFSFEILKRLCGINHRCDVDDLTVSEFTKVAWSTVSDSNQFATLSSSSAVEVFRLQCLLQVPTFELCQLTADVVSSLVMKVLPRYAVSLNDLLKIQALDCMVAISSHASMSEFRDTLFVVLMESLLHILTELDSMSDFDVFLKGKATEGLQNLLFLDDSLPRFIMWLTDKKTHRVTMFLSSLRDVTHVVENQRMYGHQCSYAPIVDLALFRMENAAVSAAEILLSVLCMSLKEFESDSMFVPICYVVSTCVEFLQCNQFMNHHIVYLTIHMICREQRGIFFSIVQTYPELLSSLANIILRDEDAEHFKTPIRLILSFLQDLLQTCSSFRTVAARQMRVLEAITKIANASHGEVDADKNEIRVVAIQILYTLSYDVFNRRLMARRANVLSSMIRFVRGIEVGASTVQISDTPPQIFHRDAIKERISQLVAVL
jgi:hypothetical protein